jgi:hypothetical protein
MSDERPDWESLSGDEVKVRRWGLGHGVRLDSTTSAVSVTASDLNGLVGSNAAWAVEVEWCASPLGWHPPDSRTLSKLVDDEHAAFDLAAALVLLGAGLLEKP